MGMFQQATREQLKARIALDGPTGGGKTYNGLVFAFALAGPNGRVCVIDTENRSASKYAGYSPHGVPWVFQVCNLKHYAPSTYTAAIREAGTLGFDVILIDSLSHAWEGVGGALDQVDKKASETGNSFTAWKDVTPQHREMVEAILASPAHVIVTMRSKMEYVMEESTNRAGKKVMVPKKVGMAPIQRQGMEYEFDIVCDLDIDHMLKVSKTRCPEIDGMHVSKPGPEFMTPVIRWLNEGVSPSPEFVAVTDPPAEQPAEQPAIEQQAASTASLDATSGAPKPAGWSDNDPCHEFQRDEIIKLAMHIGQAKDWQKQETIAWLQAMLAKKGKSKVAELTYREADSLISFLESQRTQAEAAQVMGDIAESANRSATAAQ
jgi:hypothetical protein